MRLPPLRTQRSGRVGFPPGALLSTSLPPDGINFLGKKTLPVPSARPSKPRHRPEAGGCSPAVGAGGLCSVGWWWRRGAWGARGTPRDPRLPATSCTVHCASGEAGRGRACRCPFVFPRLPGLSEAAQRVPTGPSTATPNELFMGLFFSALLAYYN